MLAGTYTRVDATHLACKTNLACPPEDSGGPPGYAHLLEVPTDPSYEDYADLKQWVGRGFDPEKFNLAAVNKKLATLSKRLARGWH